MGEKEKEEVIVIPTERLHGEPSSWTRPATEQEKKQIKKYTSKSGSSGTTKKKDTKKQKKYPTKSGTPSKENKDKSKTKDKKKTKTKSKKKLDIDPFKDEQKIGEGRRGEPIYTRSAIKLYKKPVTVIPIERLHGEPASTTKYVTYKKEAYLYDTRLSTGKKGTKYPTTTQQGKRTYLNNNKDRDLVETPELKGKSSQMPAKLSKTKQKKPAQKKPTQKPSKYETVLRTAQQKYRGLKDYLRPRYEKVTQQKKYGFGGHTITETREKGKKKVKTDVGEVKAGVYGAVTIPEAVYTAGRQAGSYLAREAKKQFYVGDTSVAQRLRKTKTDKKIPSFGEYVGEVKAGVYGAVTIPEAVYTAGRQAGSYLAREAKKQFYVGDTSVAQRLRKTKTDKKIPSFGEYVGYWQKKGQKAKDIGMDIKSYERGYRGEFIGSMVGFALVGKAAKTAKLKLTGKKPVTVTTKYERLVKGGKTQLKPKEFYKTKMPVKDIKKSVKPDSIGVKKVTYTSGSGAASKSRAIYLQRPKNIDKILKPKKSTGVGRKVKNIVTGTEKEFRKRLGKEKYLETPVKRSLAYDQYGKAGTQVGRMAKDMKVDLKVGRPKGKVPNVYLYDKVKVPGKKGKVQSASIEEIYPLRFVKQKSKKVGKVIKPKYTTKKRRTKQVTDIDDAFPDSTRIDVWNRFKQRKTQVTGTPSNALKRVTQKQKPSEPKLKEFPDYEVTPIITPEKSGTISPYVSGAALSRPTTFSTTSTKISVAESTVPQTGVGQPVSVTPVQKQVQKQMQKDRQRYSTSTTLKTRSGEGQKEISKSLLKEKAGLKQITKPMQVQKQATPTKTGQRFGTKQTPKTVTVDKFTKLRPPITIPKWGSPNRMRAFPQISKSRKAYSLAFYKGGKWAVSDIQPFRRKKAGLIKGAKKALKEEEITGFRIFKDKTKKYRPARIRRGSIDILKKFEKKGKGVFIESKKSSGGTRWGL